MGNFQLRATKYEFKCMASEVIFEIVEPTQGAENAILSAENIFKEIEASCSRFIPDSPLMVANSAPHLWHELPELAVSLIQGAYGAYCFTGGVFDPRILNDLVASGYDSSMQFLVGPVGSESIVTATFPAGGAYGRLTEKWTPEFNGAKVCLGTLPIDLGGIGKGFAVTQAMVILKEFGAGVLVEAGGDIAVTGKSPEGELWRIGVEDPWAPDSDPVLVVELENSGIATSSIRLRSWKKEGALTHHLIDPSTGTAGGEGLVSVTVIAESTQLAEVWSKTLFLAGAHKIAATAKELKIAVAWIERNRNVHTNVQFDDYVSWAAPAH